MFQGVTYIQHSKRTNSYPSRLLLAPYLIVLALSGCGSNDSKQNLEADFTVTISPTAVTILAGATVSAFSVSITGRNGFTGTASVSLIGLPADVSSSPASSFDVAAGHTQAVTLSVSSSSPGGTFTVGVTATSGSLSHGGQVALTITASSIPTVRTYDTGTMLYLETTTSAETVRVGLRKAWGGAITEVSLNGVNYVNSDDPGRQIQVSLWDANVPFDPYSGCAEGFNPVESGDHFFNGSPLLSSTLESDSIYTKSQPLQWAPEFFGGGPGNPILGDAYIEKWICPVPGHNRVFKVHYGITHFGTDSHAGGLQELPVMYVNPNVPRFVYYGGNAPWTGAALSEFAMPGACCAALPTPEEWGAYVDAAGVGIALYTPGQYPNSKGFNAGSTLQYTPSCPFSWDPGSVLEFDFYILVGPINDSRAAIYALHGQQSGTSPFTPWGYLDNPAGGDTLAGTASLDGWVWALLGMASVDVFVDGSQVGSATYGLDFPGVGIAWPGAPVQVGFHYDLNTTRFTNGSHSIVAKATDTAGHVATLQTKQITISN